MAGRSARNSGLVAKPRPIVTHDCIQIDDRIHQIHKVVVHRFRVGDVEDPDLYAAQPLWEWQQSEMGKWVMDKSVDTPEWHRQASSFLLWGFEYCVTAKLKGVDYTFWQLKWGLTVDTN